MKLIDLELSDLIAMAAALISGLSALYARWAWNEARRANELTLLGHRKAIFDAFFHLKMHMAQKGRFASLDEVSKFYYPSRDASIYYGGSIAEKISNYYSACHKVADLARVQPLEDCEIQEVSECLRKSRDLEPEIEKAIAKILDRTK
ncbi:hypothetical protein [Azotobacter beijerinckii]|uniref:hypothetical protein n=1 Tax=Azotobacter beijerinckii TaxID=170623 RepID=UPI0011145212|nr:hypothetical protein [Azotobacter beijerinckii]